MQLAIVEQNKQILRVALKGSLDMEGVQKIGDRFSILTGANKTNTIVDMSEVDYIASMGMGMLISASKASTLDQKKLVLLKPQKLVKDTLRTARLEKFILIADSLSEAEDVLKENSKR